MTTTQHFPARGGRRLHRGVMLAVLLFVGAARDWCQADASTNGDNAPPHPAWPAPILPATNAASSTFLDSHPELKQQPATTPSLSLHGQESSGEPPEATPLNPGASSARQFLFPEGAPGELADHLLVVYNTRDPDSKELAEYYASRRAIQPDHILGIATSTDEEINRVQYETSVREPIISYIYKKGWMTRRSMSARIGGRSLDLLLATHNDIWAMVLMRGIPLKIMHDPTRPESMEPSPELQSNAAAVDSELSLLPIFGLPAGGFVPNAFFDGTGNGPVRAGPELATKIILVTRLDGPRAADVKRVIDDTLYAEENRLAGLAVVDSRGLTDNGNPYTRGDGWLRSSEKSLVDDGWMVKFDTQDAVLPPTDPCNQVAIYLGWYHEGVFGPWNTPPDRFVRGAIAYHLHSFSAATMRDANRDWVGPLIAHGAAATMGAVYEPYLDLTPHLDIFTRRLLAGNTFAEAAYASQRALSWMITVVGDPLYRPFQKSLDSAVESAGEPSSPEYDWLLLQQIQRGVAAGEIIPTTGNLEHFLNVPGAVAQEGLGDLLSKLTDPDALVGARQAYTTAGALALEPIDKIRIGLKLVQVDNAMGRGEEAQGELTTLRENFPVDAARFGVPGAQIASAPPPTQPGRPSTYAPSKPPGPPKPTPVP